MANRNFPNGGKLYAYHMAPVSITAKFTVAATNANGITALTGAAGVANVFMHTSTTPTVGNPNPIAGFIMVQLKDNFNKIIKLDTTLQSPNDTTQTTTTAGHVYTITALGTATLAQWKAAGLQAGIAPAVGVAFVAIATGTIGGAATVAPPLTTGITNIEIVGDPNTTIAPIGTVGLGSILVLQCLKNDVLTQPADGSIITLEILMNNSSVSAGAPSPGN